MKRGYVFSYCRYFIVWMLVNEDFSGRENPRSELYGRQRGVDNSEWFDIKLESAFKT